MIWIVNGTQSYQAVGMNVSDEPVNNKYGLWIERPSGKTIKVYESESKDLVNEYLGAINYAIEKGSKTFEIK